MNFKKLKQNKRERRRRRIRAKVVGTAERPRLSVFRSNRAITAQLIDDTKGVTIASASSREVQDNKSKAMVDKAFAVGKLIATKAAAIKVKQVVFDRAGYVYAGRVRALAQGAREGGLKF
jgi:large subunit ribosomal protein L18